MEELHSLHVLHLIYVRGTIPSGVRAGRCFSEFASAQAVGESRDSLVYVFR